MKRLFPSPYLSAALFVLWLLLNGSTSPGHLLLATTLALVVPLWTATLRPSPARLKHPRAAARLGIVIVKDAIVSNLAVARLVWQAGRRPPRSTFVRIPLDVRDPNGLAALAIIAAVIPGTIWTELAMDRSTLLLHLFDVDDEDAYICYFKQRYERPLMEIFE